MRISPFVRTGRLQLLMRIYPPLKRVGYYPPIPAGIEELF